MHVTGSFRDSINNDFLLSQQLRLFNDPMNLESPCTFNIKMADKNDDVLKKETVALMEALLNGGIKVKSAAEVGKRAVEYTRGDEIAKWILNNKDSVCKLCPRLLADLDINYDEDEDIMRVCNVLIEAGFMYRAQYQPFEGTIEKTSTGSFRRPTWPKRLIKTQKQRFDPVGFYIISYEGNQRWNYFMLTAMILGIFSICMFQAWPLALKLAVWYISVVLLAVLVGDYSIIVNVLQFALILLRLVLFVCFWFCGYDFWLFPNLFDEDLGVVDSFKPLHSLEYRNDTTYMLCCRVLCSILLAASVNELRKTHDLRDVGDFARQSFMDIIEWGHNKLTAVPEEPSLYKSIGMDISTEFDSEERSEEAGEDGLDDDGNAFFSDPHFLSDYKCLLACGYRSLHQLMKECMLSCDCMKELLDNPCLSGCPEETIRVLTESKADICRKTRKTTLSLTNISGDITVSSICILIDNQFKCLNTDYNDERDPGEKFVLFCGHKQLKNTSQLSEYNVVGLPELTFYLYERRSLNVTVHLITSVKCCGVYFSPVFGKLFARRVSFTVLDQETVLRVKELLLDLLEGYTNRQGKHLTLEEMHLVHQRLLLEDDLQQVKEVNDGNDLKLTLLMPLDYSVRPPSTLSPEAVPTPAKAEPEAVPEMPRTMMTCTLTTEPVEGQDDIKETEEVVNEVSSEEPKSENAATAA
ncbi:Translocation protein SEC62 [Babesia sp. Xinjiang]|uniref:Translocation protein SEC62 n=1 Tax=Babesia sp. Xinjiang TaxID=462227 RepID=UPI000A259063|nr:Translocation protein SEC62 [Babesia sp. Xinjiang]ORM42183.1 Translocation protein SEC62 [Babesia sp. Xinjiang]